MVTGRIRTMNGHNENPTATQFMSAYRKLLHHLDVLISDDSNVMPSNTSNVLTVSSYNDIKLCNQLDRTESIEDEEWFELMELNDLKDMSQFTDNNNDAGISYVPHILEKRLLSGTIYCDYCKNVLLNNVFINLCVLHQFMCVGHDQPTKSTYLLCKLTDIALKHLINTGPNIKQKVYLMVMNDIEIDQMFPLFYDPVHDIDHKHFIIKFIIDEYINKKCSYVSKHNTIALQKRYVRNKLRKIAHYMSQ